MSARILSATFMILTLTAPAMAGDFSALPPHKQTRLGLYHDPAEAAAILETEAARTLFVDVRTQAEVTFIGMPTQADANIPYAVPTDTAEFDEKAKSFKLEANSDFVSEIARRLAAKGLGKKDRIILICRSGDRSARAADLLAAVGYTQVYSVAEGFEGDIAKSGDRKGQRSVNGWKNANLPWSYQLEKSKMYKVD